MSEGIVPAFDPDTGASGGPSSGGGNPDLVSGGAATNGNQALAAGTTSSSAITFQAPTGGSGSSTPSVALDQTNGTGATLSGSGLGPYTVSTLEDGDICRVTCTHTDDGDGQVVKDVAVIAVGNPAGVSYPVALLDWSSSSETFAGGEGAYTIGGLSVTYSFDGTSGPDSIDLSSGVLTLEITNPNKVYFVIDLGEDVTDETVVAYVTSTGVAAGTVTAVLLKVSSGTTIGNAANQWQAAVGHGGSETLIRFREANSASGFTNVETPTVTDITTTPTRVSLWWHGASGEYSYDQGDATLPTNAAHLGTIGASVINDSSAALARQNRRYVHLLVQADCTLRLAAYKRSIAV